jgi:hypothetical protein
MSPFNYHVLLNWARNDLLVPIRALLFRFMVLGTYGIVKFQAGAETGFTLLGDSIFLWANDGVDGVHYSQYAYRSKAKVFRLRNVFQVGGGHRVGEGQD